MEQKKHFNESRGLMPLRNAARKYKIPASWLEREARAGRLSCLIADDAVLFDEATLIKEIRGRVRNEGCDDEKK